MFLLGDAPLNDYRKQLERLIEKLEVKDHVLFHGAVPLDELWKYIGAADISMVIIEPVAKSYYLALPNKLFESIQAHMPVVGSNLPEIERIIQQYEIGETCRGDDIRDIYRAVRNIKEDKKKKEQYRKNGEEASKELCWEKESRHLADAYKKIWISLS